MARPGPNCDVVVVIALGAGNDFAGVICNVDVSLKTASRATIALSQPATAGAALVVSENYFPGWTALVDGKPQPTFRANYNLIGVPLPTGARTVELSFHDAAVDTGKGITLAAVVLAALLLAGGIVIDRRGVV